jgi:hypothetical protein
MMTVLLLVDLLEVLLVDLLVVLVVLLVVLLATIARKVILFRDKFFRLHRG